jgi:hypothetical protein
MTYCRGLSTAFMPAAAFEVSTRPNDAKFRPASSDYLPSSGVLLECVRRS